MNEVATELTCLGVTGILIVAAEQGVIASLDCAMPTCHCPTELGGRSYFEPVATPSRDWMPSHDHFPKLKSKGGRRVVENSRLAHRLCNRVDFSVGIDRRVARDMARVEADRRSAIAGTMDHRKWLRDVARMLCGAEEALLRSFVGELQGWADVTAEPFYDRGSGPTGIRMTRGKRRFVNVFPGKSVQFAHGGSPLQGLGLSSEPSIDRGYQPMPVSDLAEGLDEARLLAAFAYWKAGEGQIERGSHARGR